MRYVVVTSKQLGLASLFVGLLASSESGGQNALAVVLCRGGKTNGARSRSVRRRLRKIRRIGLLGAINGLRMRRWYGRHVSEALGLEDIHRACDNARIPVIEIESFGDRDSQEAVRRLAPDLGISLGNGLIPESFFQIPRLGMINLHHELLPEYRGAQTALWQLHDNSRQTGFSIHEVTQVIDGGRVLLRESMPILFRRTLHQTIVQTAAAVQQKSVQRLVDVITGFDQYQATAVKASEGSLYTTPGGMAMLRIYRNYWRLRREEI